MSMRDKLLLVFGSQQFEIRPLTIAQVERLEEVVMGSPFLGGEGGSATTAIKTAKEVVKVALMRDHAAVDVAELEATPRQLADAQIGILRLAGFTFEPGEARAAAQNASTGETSEGA